MSLAARCGLRAGRSTGRSFAVSGTAFARLCLLPLAIVVAAFFLLPMARLVEIGAGGPKGLAAYAAILIEPRYRATLINTVVPAFIASGAIAFATAMGAFGTAFTLATNIDVLPMLIYTEFTLAANLAMAAALSVGLGLVAWAILALARSFAGATVAAAG